MTRASRGTALATAGTLAGSVTAAILWAAPACAQEAPPAPASAGPVIIVLPPAPFPAPPPFPAAPPLAVEYAPPPPPPPPPPPSRLPARPQTRFTWRLDGGVTFSRIYDIGVTGGEGTIAVGAEFPKHLAIYGSLSVFGGVQETGLSALQLHLATVVEGRFGRFRLGGGLSFGEIALGRATGPSDNEALTFGALALASFDLFQWGEHDESALYLTVKVLADAVLGLDAAPLIWGPTVALGVRF